MSLMLPCDRLDLGEFTRRNGHGLGGDRPVRGGRPDRVGLLYYR